MSTLRDDIKFTKRQRATLRRRRRLTAALILAEGATASLWRIISWLALFAGLWMLRVPTVFGVAGPGIVLAVFVIGLLYLLRADIKKFKWPHRHVIDRRLEDASRLPHRPLEIIEDRPANAHDADGMTLWHAQKKKSLALLSQLRVPAPQPVLAARDPYGLRILAALVLFLGIIAAGPQWLERLTYGIKPYDIKMPGHDMPYLTLWITPPEYTNQPRLTLEGTGQRHTIMSIPERSIVKIRVNSALGEPTLDMGGHKIPLQALDSRSWGLETEIKPGEELRITQMMLPRATVPYEIITDQPPTITVTGDAEIMERAELQFPITVNDDYGVADLQMNMTLDAMVEDKPLGGPFTDTRPVMSAPGADHDMQPLYDLAWHPWAGLPVEITFTAHDKKGQSTTTEPVKMVLPERTFNHPVAARLIELRKQLAWTPEASAKDVSDALLEILPHPEQYAGDPIVFLSIRTMASRLHYEPTVKTALEVIPQLWDTAITIEDGNLPLAARALRDAQRNLANTLNDPNATDEEIAQAMDEMREAMSEYFRELAREMQKRMAQGENMMLSPEMLQGLMNPEDIANFLDQLQAQALSGDRQSAREMLSQLEQLMDALDPSVNTAMPPQMEFMMDGINELQQLIEKQRALLDQTEEQASILQRDQIERVIPEILPLPPEILQRWGEQNMPPPPQQSLPPGAAPEIDSSTHKVEQDALRYILGKLMLDADEQLGEIPEKMGLAEQEMRYSATQLGDNRPDYSVPHQEKAIEYLQDAMNDMAQQMAQMMQQMMMMAFGGMGKTDPLGRPMSEGQGPSWLHGNDVKIPDEAERKRVQEIQKLLRDRAGELDRPDYELDYYRRLLKQF